MSWLPDRPWLRTLALAGSLAAAMFLMWQSDEPPQINQKAAELRGEAEPDGFVVNGEYTSFDEAGKLKISFTSPRIEQFEEGNLATMVSPRAKLFSDQASASAEPWIIEAENGSLLQNENLLYLTGNVRILRSVGGRDTTLTTPTLTLDNDRSLAYTDAPVVIRDVTGITRATGMKAWIDDRILELNSQVEGIYETGN